MRNALPAADFYARVREILESARGNLARSVNTTQVVANWLIGREIVEEEQRGQKRADYGERLLADLSVRLQADYGKGFSIQNLEHFRDFYLTYVGLVVLPIPHAAHVGNLSWTSEMHFRFRTRCVRSSLTGQRPRNPTQRVGILMRYRRRS